MASLMKLRPMLLRWQRCRGAPPLPRVSSTVTHSTVQDLRAQIDILRPEDLGEIGTNMKEMGLFFSMFGKITALLEAARKRAEDETASLATLAEETTEAMAAGTEGTQGSQIPAGQPHLISLIPAEDFDDASSMDAAEDGGAQAALDLANKLLEDVEAQAVLLPADDGPSG